MTSKYKSFKLTNSALKEAKYFVNQYSKAELKVVNYYKNNVDNSENNCDQLSWVENMTKFVNLTLWAHFCFILMLIPIILSTILIVFFGLISSFSRIIFHRLPFYDFIVDFIFGNPLYFALVIQQRCFLYDHLLILSKNNEKVDKIKDEIKQYAMYNVQATFYG